MVNIPLVDGLSEEVQRGIESANEREIELRKAFAELKKRKEEIVELYLDPTVADEIESLRHSGPSLQREKLEVAKLKLEAVCNACRHLSENGLTQPKGCPTEEEFIEAKRETVRLQNLLNSGQSESLSRDQKQLANLVKQTSIYAKYREEARKHREDCQAMNKCRSALQTEVEEIDNTIKQSVRAMVGMI